jgi:hypothetical protein
MRWIAFLLIGVAMGTGVIVLTAPASGQGGGEAVPIFGIKIPPGYRDWRFISVAHEEGDLHSFAAILGNDVAIKAYRDGKLPFPDGTIIAALHLQSRPVGGKQQSLRPFPIVRSRATHQRAVYGQGFKKIRHDGRLGVRAL